MLPVDVFALRFTSVAKILRGMMPMSAVSSLGMMPMMRRFQLGDDRGHGRIGRHFGGMQLDFKGMLLLMQGLLFVLGGDTFTFGLEGRELLLQALMLRFEGRIGGESRFLGCLQLGLLVGSQDGIMVVMPSGRVGRSRG